MSLILAADYQNEGELGRALAEAFNTGLVRIFSLLQSLKKLQLDYLGVGTTASALDEEGVLDIDTTILLETTWHAMEQTVSMDWFVALGSVGSECASQTNSVGKRSKEGGQINRSLLTLGCSLHDVEIQELGFLRRVATTSFNLLVSHGGLGDVVLCKNKLDGRQYDVKKIQLKGGSHPLNYKIKYLVGIANKLAFLVLYPSGGRAD
ncbi:putative mannose-6-phosphate 6-reductase [Helianthus annuus]|nr:putative mannose-6-phosphate 6-reductase [Helianthus annuus]